MLSARIFFNNLLTSSMLVACGGASSSLEETGRDSDSHPPGHPDSHPPGHPDSFRYSSSHDHPSAVRNFQLDYPVERGESICMEKQSREEIVQLWSNGEV